MTKRVDRIAVFARNHPEYLAAAASRNAEAPARHTTFRSRQRWSRAKAAIDKHGELRIFFAPIGGQTGVEYEALLRQAHLDPDREDPVTREILASVLDSTWEEGLWDETDKGALTLYVISHCRRLAKPFPITLLTKVSDGTPISPDYGYSYCIVQERVGLPPGDFETHPEEVRDPRKYPEGATRRISVNAYERSATARADCIAHHGLECAVCRFDFEKTYGDRGKGFIHVHHRKPLAEVQAGYEVDPIQDLVPLCPNCHAMLHRSAPVGTVESLQKALRKDK